MPTPNPRRGREPVTALEARDKGFDPRASGVPARVIQLVDPLLTAPEPIVRDLHRVPEQALALFAHRDRTTEILAGWWPVLDDSVIEAEARAYLASPLRNVLAFGCWMIARGL
jgi:hypothetical protein